MIWIAMIYLYELTRKNPFSCSALPLRQIEMEHLLEASVNNQHPFTTKVLKHTLICGLQKLIVAFDPITHLYMTHVMLWLLVQSGGHRSSVRYRRCLGPRSSGNSALSAFWHHGLANSSSSAREGPAT